MRIKRFKTQMFVLYALYIHGNSSYILLSFFKPQIQSKLWKNKYTDLSLDFSFIPSLDPYRRIAMRNWEKDDITFGKTTAKILKLAGLIHSESLRRFRNDKQNKSYMVTGREREQRHGQFLDEGNVLLQGSKLLSHSICPVPLQNKIMKDQ